MAEWNKIEERRQAQQPSQDNSKWNNMLAMLSMVNRTSPDTMLGYGLGKMLKRWVGTAWDDYLRSRDNRKNNSNNEAGGAGQANIDAMKANDLTQLEKGLLNSGAMTDTAIKSAKLGEMANLGDISSYKTPNCFGGFPCPDNGVEYMGAMVIPETQTPADFLPLRGK